MPAHLLVSWRLADGNLSNRRTENDPPINDFVNGRREEIYEMEGVVHSQVSTPTPTLDA
jgi:hypothetical protein